MAYPCLPLALALAAFSIGAAPDPGYSIELEPKRWVQVPGVCPEPLLAQERTMAATPPADHECYRSAADRGSAQCTNQSH